MQFISVGGGVQSNDIILLQGYCYNEFLIGGCMVITFVVQYVSWMMNIAFDKLWLLEQTIYTSQFLVEEVKWLFEALIPLL